MTIITDSTVKKPRAEPRDVEAQQPDEQQPLLSPPLYSSSASSLPSAANGNPLKVPPFPEREKTSKIKFVLVCLLMLFGVHLVLRLFGGWGGGEGGDWVGGREGSWSKPPTHDGTGFLLPTLDSSTSPPHPHEPHSHYPNQRLYSRLVTIELPLTSKKNDFFFHALGSDAVGSLEVVPGSNEDGVVKVEIVVVYASEERVKERVRVYKMEDIDGRVGVDILTPTNRPSWRGASDYISFEVKIVLPTRFSNSSSHDGLGTLNLGAFDGEANGMSLQVGELGKGWRFESFEYKTRNNGLVVKSLNSDSIRLKTTNGRISASSFNATTLELESSNGSIDLQGAMVKAHSIDLHTTNGIIRTGESLVGLSTVEADLIVIKTSNSAIRGSWTAKEIRATTSNAEISGSFFGIEKSLLLHTSNDPIRASIQTHASTPITPLSSIPIEIKTSSGSLDITFQPDPSYLFGKSIPLNASLVTSNANAFVTAKYFLGEFETRTSHYQKTVVECSGAGGRRVESSEGGGDEKGRERGVVKGKVLDRSSNDGGRLEVRTSNGGVKLLF